jgi:hypothetical protein
MQSQWLVRFDSYISLTIPCEIQWVLTVLILLGGGRTGLAPEKLRQCPKVIKRSLDHLAITTNTSVPEAAPPPCPAIIGAKQSLLW